MSDRFRGAIRAVTFRGETHDLSCSGHHHSTPKQAALCAQRRLRGCIPNTRDGVGQVQYAEINFMVTRYESASNMWINWGFVTGLTRN